MNAKVVPKEMLMEFVTESGEIKTLLSYHMGKTLSTKLPDATRVTPKRFKNYYNRL